MITFGITQSLTLFFVQYFADIDFKFTVELHMTTIDTKSVWLNSLFCSFIHFWRNEIWIYRTFCDRSLSHSIILFAKVCQNTAILFANSFFKLNTVEHVLERNRLRKYLSLLRGSVMDRFHCRYRHCRIFHSILFGHSWLPCTRSIRLEKKWWKLFDKCEEKR